eukprot:431634_1
MNCPSTKVLYIYSINLCWLLSGFWLWKCICEYCCCIKVDYGKNRKICKDLSELYLGEAPTVGVVVVDEENKFIRQINHLYCNNKAKFGFIHTFPVRYWYGVKGQGVVHLIGLYLYDQLNHSDWTSEYDEVWDSAYLPRHFKKDYGLIYVVYANNCESIDYLQNVYDTLSYSLRCRESIVLIWNPHKVVLDEDFQRRLKRFTGIYSWWDCITQYEPIHIDDKMSCKNALEMYVRCLFNELNNSDA